MLKENLLNISKPFRILLIQPGNKDNEPRQNVTNSRYKQETS